MANIGFPTNTINFGGAQTTFIHGALKDKYSNPEIYAKAANLCGPETKFIHGALKETYLIQIKQWKFRGPHIKLIHGVLKGTNLIPEIKLMKASK